jgi:hypothetical protein
MGTDSTGISSFHDEVSILGKRCSPAVSDDPLFLLCLAYDCDGVVEWFLGAVPEGSGLALSVVGQLSSCDHGCNGVSFAQFYLDGLATAGGQHSEPFYLILLHPVILHDVLPAGIRMPSFAAIGIRLLLDKANPHGILEPFSDISTLTAIDQLILARTIYQLLFG